MTFGRGTYNVCLLNLRNLCKLLCLTLCSAVMDVSTVVLHESCLHVHFKICCPSWFPFVNCFKCTAKLICKCEHTSFSKKPLTAIMTPSLVCSDVVFKGLHTPNALHQRQQSDSSQHSLHVVGCIHQADGAQCWAVPIESCTAYNTHVCLTIMASTSEKLGTL